MQTIVKIKKITKSFLWMAFLLIGFCTNFSVYAEVENSTAVTINTLRQYVSQYNGNNSGFWMQSFAQFSRDKVVDSGSISAKELITAACINANNKKVCQTGIWGFYPEMLGALNTLDYYVDNHCPQGSGCSEDKRMLAADIDYLKGYLK